MRMDMRHCCAALLAVGLLGGCKGYVTSDHPLLTPRNGEFPLASGTEISGWTLGDDKVWEQEEHASRLVVVDGAYRIVEPGRTEADTDRFLVKQTGSNEFVVQASNGSEWAYGLIVRADMYYVFTFNRDDENCTKLSPDERERLHMVVRDASCVMGSLQDLVALLKYLRRKYPHPTSAFMVRQTTR